MFRDYSCTVVWYDNSLMTTTSKRLLGILRSHAGIKPAVLRGWLQLNNRIQSLVFCKANNLTVGPSKKRILVASVILVFQVVSLFFQLVADGNDIVHQKHEVVMIRVADRTDGIAELWSRQ